MGQSTHKLTDGTAFPPTVTEHTRFSGGIRLHTIDNDPDRDIITFFDERPPRFAGERGDNE